jgi:hypothetical protein
MRALFGKRVSLQQEAAGARPPSAQAVSESRRGFFTKAAVGAVSLSGTAGLAKVAVDSLEKPDLSGLYRKDNLAGEQDLIEREFVVMSSSEKDEMVQQFVDDYYAKG